MTKSAKYVHALLLSSAGDLAGMQGTRKQRSARHVARWKMSARFACWILNMVYQFRSGIQHSLSIRTMQFQGVMSIVNILQKSMIEGYVLFLHHWNLNAGIQILYFLDFFSFILKLSYVFKYHFYDDIVNKLMVSSTILCLGNTNRMSFLWCPICICNLPDLP